LPQSSLVPEPLPLLLESLPLSSDEPQAAVRASAATPATEAKRAFLVNPVMTVSFLMNRA